MVAAIPLDLPRPHFGACAMSIRDLGGAIRATVEDDHDLVRERQAVETCTELVFLVVRDDEGRQTRCCAAPAHTACSKVRRRNCIAASTTRPTGRLSIWVVALR